MAVHWAIFDHRGFVRRIDSLVCNGSIDITHCNLQGKLELLQSMKAIHWNLTGSDWAAIWASVHGQRKPLEVTPCFPLDCHHEFANVPVPRTNNLVMQMRVPKPLQTWAVFEKFGDTHLVDTTVQEIDRFKSCSKAAVRIFGFYDAPVLEVRHGAMAPRLRSRKDCIRKNCIRGKAKKRLAQFEQQKCWGTSGTDSPNLLTRARLGLS